MLEDLINITLVSVVIVFFVLFLINYFSLSYGDMMFNTKFITAMRYLENFSYSSLKYDKLDNLNIQVENNVYILVKDFETDNVWEFGKQLHNQYLALSSPVLIEDNIGKVYVYVS